MREAERIPRLAAQLDRAAKQVHGTIDLAALEEQVGHGRHREGHLDAEAVLAGDLQRAREVWLRTVQVPPVPIDRVQDVERLDVPAQIPGAALGRRDPDGLLQRRDGLVEAPETAEDGAAVGEIAGNPIGIARVAIERQGAIHGVERFLAPPLQPEQEALAAERVALAAAVVEAAAERKRLVEPPFALVEVARRREQFRLAHVGDGQFGTVTHRLEDREQAIDRLLLLAAVAQHLADLFLLEQQAYQRRPALVIGQAPGPLERQVEGGPRVLELAHLPRPAREPLSVFHGFGPVLGLGEVAREDAVLILEMAGVDGFDRASDLPVQDLPLPLKQAVVGHLLGQRVLEAIGRFRNDARLADQATFLEGDQAPGHVEVRAGHGRQHRRGELEADDRRAAQQVPRITVEAIEPRPDDRLHAVGELQALGGARHPRFPVLDADGPLFVQLAADLLEKEGIAARPLVQSGRKRFRDAIRLQNGAHDVPGRHRTERHQVRRSDVTQPAPVDPAVGPVRRHHHEGITRAQVRELPHHLVRRLVHPVPVFEKHHERAVAGCQTEERSQRLLHGVACRPRVRVVRAPVRDREQVVKDGQEAFEFPIESPHRLPHLAALILGCVGLAHAEQRAAALDERQVGHARAVRLAAAFDERDPIAIELAPELVEQPALARAGIADHRDDLPFARDRHLDAARERAQFPLTPGKRRKRGIGRFERRGGRVIRRGDAERRERRAFAADMHGAGGLGSQRRAGQAPRLLAHEDVAVPHRTEQAHGIAQRISEDPHAVGLVGGRSHHEIARVHGRFEPQPVHAGVLPEPCVQCEGGERRPPRVVFVRDRDPEQRDDFLARGAVHDAAVPLDRATQHLLERRKHAVHVLGRRSLDERVVTGDSGRQDRRLTALARHHRLARRLRINGRTAEALDSRALDCWLGRMGQPLPAPAAERRLRGNLPAAARAASLELGAAPVAEPAVGRARRATGWTLGPLRHAGRRERAGARAVVAHSLEIAREIARGLVAVGGILGEAPIDRPLERRRHERVQRGRRRRLLLEDRGHRLRSAAAIERTLAREQLVDHRAEREEIRPIVHRASGRLLGRHVGERAEDRAGGRHRFSANGAAPRDLAAGLELREPEVHDLGRPVGADHDVAGLEVAVDDAARVRGREPLRDLCGQVERLIELEPSGHEPLAQAAVAQVLHRDVRDASGLADVVNRDDVRMVEGGRGPRLPAEAFGVRPPLQLAGEDLQRHVPFEPWVASAIHAAHPPFADERDDLVGPQPGSRAVLRRFARHRAGQIVPEGSRKGAAGGESPVGPVGGGEQPLDDGAEFGIGPARARDEITAAAGGTVERLGEDRVGGGEAVEGQRRHASALSRRAVARRRAHEFEEPRARPRPVASYRTRRHTEDLRGLLLAVPGKEPAFGHAGEAQVHGGQSIERVVDQQDSLGVGLD